MMVQLLGGAELLRSHDMKERSHDSLYVTLQVA